ncbi:MAG: chromosome segregation protein SMC, partial [Flavisolibacter sp.]|nr:chromosome segregation protein SMC [Flavisolibacter sp.]
LHDFLKKATGQIKGIDESIAYTIKKIEEEEKTLSELSAELTGLRRQVDAKRAVLDEKRVAVNDLRNEFQQIQRQQFDAEKKVAVADTSIQNFQRTIHHLEEDKANRDQQIQAVEKEKQEKEKALEEKQKSLEQLQQQHNQTKEQILQTQAELENMRHTLTDENRKLDAKKNEHDLLKNLIDSMEGYPESVKFLHNNKGWNHKAPILSDIIYVKEEYRAAIENVLEPYLSYYVVNNLEEGLKAIHLLDEAKKGKAAFFLLDNVADLAETDHQPKGTIPALSVIEVDEPYTRLAHQLLGNVFIAQDANALHNSNGSVVIEKSGKYVKGSYTLKGGSIGAFEGRKIGRVKNLEKLQEEIAVQKKVAGRLAAEIQKRHNDVMQLNANLKENSIRETERAIQQLQQQLYGLQNKLENLHHSQETAQKRIDELKSQLTQTQSSVENIRQEHTALNEKLSSYNTQWQQAETDYRTIEVEYNEVNTHYNSLNLQLTRQQSKISGLKQERQFKNDQLNDLKNSVQQNERQIEQTTADILSEENLLKSIKESLYQLMRRREGEEHTLNEADQKYYHLRNQLSAKESELRHLIKDKEAVEHLLTAIREKLNDIKLQLAGIKERLQVEFKVRLEDILDEPRTTETPVEELQEKADRMKKRLENLGEVNPTAIEAFEEMKKRYEFIVEQKNDLVNAKQSLLQTIAEVETTANQKLLETFNRVRDNFQQVFKALFTEDDQCDLILENPDNLAETGIDIIAKPKGKRPTSINQLSGGERTLTATALLFAIYLIKPAPFCILDEVDAPLDDANVGKFTKMIREFSGNSQFIIVTHNKATMSTVDVIYGVTMQEPGVSKLVSVDFRSLN